MLTKALVIMIVIGLLFVIAGNKEKRRVREIQAWLSSRPSARLIWPFVAAEHPDLPVNSMIERFISRPPIALAFVMHVTEADDEVLLAEFRTTPANRESSFWFTLAAHRCPDAGERGHMNLQSTADDPRVLLLDSWTCQCVNGLMSVALLDQAMAHIGRNAASPV